MANVPATVVLRRDQLSGLQLRLILSLWFLWLGFIAVDLMNLESASVIVAYAAPRVLSAALIATAVIAPLLLWRVMVIQRVFRIGKTVQATVTSVVERQGIHRVWYRYEFNGRPIDGRNLVKQDKTFRAVAAGDVVDIVVNPNRPDRSFIAGFFDLDG